MKLLVKHRSESTRWDFPAEGKEYALVDMEHPSLCIATDPPFGWIIRFGTKEELEVVKDLMEMEDAVRAMTKGTAAQGFKP